MLSRLPSLVLLALTILVGTQVAVAQVHCGLLTGVDDHDCALCHTGQVQFVEDSSSSVPVPEPPSGHVTTEPVFSPCEEPAADHRGRAPPSLS